MSFATQTSGAGNTVGKPLRNLTTGSASTAYQGWRDQEPTSIKNTLASAKVSAASQDAPQPVLPAAGLTRQVNAEVAAINADGVIFNCILPEREVAIQLPKSLISSELQRLGQAVTISFLTNNGIRMPSIQAREVVPVRDEFDRQMREWLDKR